MQNLLRQAMRTADQLISDTQPDTMEDLVELVNNSGQLSRYTLHYSIVRYMGYVQGIRIEIIARTRKHYLPSAKKVYAISKGLDKYIEAGW